MERTNLTSLWIRIENFDIDGERVAVPFEVKLAKGNGWSRGFAKRAIEEYRRFVFLAMVAGHPVTPSKIVDEVWHLHLTYTRSYWDRMVNEVLGRPLHHEPSKGGRPEDSKHADQYARTLHSYSLFFGHPPPADIWPNRAERRTGRKRRLTLATIAMGAAAILGGCAPMLAQGTNAIALWVIGGLVGLGGLGFLMYQMFGSGGDDHGMGMVPTDPNDPRNRQEGAYGGCGVATTTIPYDEREGNDHGHGADDGTPDSGDSGGGGSDSGGSDGGSDGGGCGSGCSS